MNATPQELISVGRMCGRVNALPDDIRSAAKRVGVLPGMVLDCVELFSVADIDAIAGAIRNPIVPTEFNS